MASSEETHRVRGSVGLALGSGSARGWAHIGVIRGLAEAGLRVDYVAGASIGAAVGAVFASGDLDALEDVALELDWRQVASFYDAVLPKSGLIDGTKLSAFIRNYIKETRIEQLPIPYCAVATDLETGEEVAIRDGDIVEAVRASFSIPGILTPVRWNDRILVDGGLVNPVPVNVLRAMGADFVIAVDLNHGVVGGRVYRGRAAPPAPEPPVRDVPVTDVKSRIARALHTRMARVGLPALAQIKRWRSREQLPSIFDVMTTSISIMETFITTTRLDADPPDLLIQPKLGHIRSMEFHRAGEAILEGYREAKERLANLPQ
ncbi:MAG: patatin-like phospholipase family protein [Gemmatimonadota bacterium]|nr:patatin-like phospholipase family protein [Gemmatimonadota bacterium]MDH3367037.1 patatin-like phospholipase family protein [Gemmatimonadota bacterium]MDH3477388.1 patatin-like phospholipase family protein [Gemmatimonadota bacterium]MDH3571582.1 patatin-like phospholipase family protein [Gemmatimonadota bacterium]MDH5548758.1 patatin-like phospholipase family protein [Gemmatimonadota bacterium]